MSGYTPHPGAFNDIDEIRGYIAEDNPDAADRVVPEIFQKFAAWWNSTAGLPPAQSLISPLAVRAGTRRIERQ
jgi:plasmid stabilization system protein ParE